MKAETYKNICIIIAVFQYLKGKVKSKGNEINYGKQLYCQNYLLPNNILTFHEQKLIFSYRSRMNKLLYNQAGTN